jgi:hypothetical protein
LTARKKEKENETDKIDEQRFHHSQTRQASKQLTNKQHPPSLPTWSTKLWRLELIAEEKSL